MARNEGGIRDFRFHDLRHTWASWHRQAGTSCDELKDLGGWKSRVMVDRYAKYATEHLAVAASRIQRLRDENVVSLVTFSSRPKEKKGLASSAKPLISLVGRTRFELVTNGLKVRCSTN